MEDTINVLFQAKLRSGKYNHYDDEQLKQLYLDCVKQVQAMDIYGGYHNGNKRG